MFEKIGNEIETNISTFSSDLSSALISNLMPIISVSVILYFTLKGWLFLSGRAQGAISDTVITAFKIALVAFIGLNTGNFITLGIGTINSLEGFLINSLPFSSATSWAMVDQLWKSIANSIQGLVAVFSQFSFDEIGYALLWAIVFVIYLVIAAGLTTAALGVLIMAKISLVLVVGFGPLFICALMFPITRSWFDGWLKSCLTYIFTLVMMSALISLVILIFQGQLEKIQDLVSSVNNGGNGSITILIVRIFGFLIICVALASMIKMIPSMAAGIVGGVAMQAVGLGAMLTGTSAGALNIAMASSLGVGQLSRSTGLSQAASNYFQGRSATGKALSSEGGLGAYAVGAAAGAASGAIMEMSKFGYLRAKRAIDAAKAQSN